MTTYKEIFGKPIKFISSDLSNDAATGEIWYNSTTGKFKSIVAGGAWSSGANMATGRTNGANAGTLTAALAAGGNTPPVTTATEEYNGSGWSAGGTLGTGRLSAGSATNAPQTAAIIYGGQSPGKTAVTEEYNGTSWSEVADLSTARWSGASFGNAQTAAVMAGGDGYPPSSGRYKTETEEFDGSSWSTGGALGTAGTEFMGSGIESAGLAAGGEGGRPNTSVEEYNGTAWTAGTDMPIGRTSGAMAGLQTASIQYGGVSSPGPVATTISYDGSAWTTTPNMAVAKYANQTGAGSSTAAISAGSHPAQAPNAQTEEYNFTANTVTAGAWASAPSIGTGRYLGGYGITPTNASIIFGGQSATGSVANTETYDGSSWSEQPDLNNARSRITGFGTQTAAVTMGGRQVGTPTDNMNNTETYDGSSWTNAPTYPLTARGIGGAGTNAAGLAIAAWTGSPPGVTTCNDWNGSGWTAAEGNLNTARGYVSGWGTQGDAGAAGGPPGNTNYEEYNGSSWTAKSAMVSATGAPSGGEAGFGGTPGAIKGNGNGGTFSQVWNGTAWATGVSRANTNYGGGMSGGNTAASGLITGGYIYPSTGPATGTEEFTGETTSANIVTVTTS